MQMFCSSCDCEQPVEYIDEDAGDDMVFCTVCGDEFSKHTAASSSQNESLRNYVVGSVISVEPVPSKRDLKVTQVAVNERGDTVQIVTNAKYIEAGWKVVVALSDAVVPAGSILDEDPNAFRVKPTSVGGVKSEGMICDSFMLSWSGGAKGVVQQLPETFAIGDAPPLERPRAV